MYNILYILLLLIKYVLKYNQFNVLIIPSVYNYYKSCLTLHITLLQMIFTIDLKLITL